jgi:hypothetical protein
LKLSSLDLLIMNVKTSVDYEPIAEFIQFPLCAFSRSVTNQLHLRDPILALSLFRHFESSTVITLSPEQFTGEHVTSERLQSYNLIPLDLMVLLGVREVE